MKLSDIFKFKLFDGSDKANLKIVNENFEIAEKELAATNKEITDKVTEINNKITELNGLLGGKLDVSKIANNLVTTEEGYALDARMGKVLNDSVNNVINDINGIIHKLSLTATYDGNKCTINFNTHDTAAGIIVLYGQFSGTSTCFTAVLVKRTMYADTIELGVGGANFIGYTLSKDSITIESDKQVTGIEHVKGIIIGM